MQQEYWNGSSTISYDQQKEMTKHLKCRLENVREHCKMDLLEKEPLVDQYENMVQERGLDNKFYISMKETALRCTEMMLELAGVIMSQSVNILRDESPCDFDAVAIGSLARGEATPYSDLEYLFLIEEKSDDNMCYFEKLAVTSYFVIGNLRETKLSHVAIEELQGWFEDMSQCGIQIDGLSMGAGNIPTGNGSREQINQFIVTPEELAERYRHVLHNPGDEALRGDLTSMLTYTKSFFSKQGKNTDPLGEFRQRLAHITPNQTRKDINFKMLNTDIEKLTFMPWNEMNNRGYNCDAKKELYRFPSIILLDLTIILGNSAGTSWENIEQQSSQKAIPQQLSSHLRFALAAAVYIRL